LNNPIGFATYGREDFVPTSRPFIFAGITSCIVLKPGDSLKTSTGRSSSCRISGHQLSFDQKTSNRHFFEFRRMFGKAHPSKRADWFREYCAALQLVLMLVWYCCTNKNMERLLRTFRHSPVDEVASIWRSPDRIAAL
jgi:hypothetical protein